MTKGDEDGEMVMLEIGKRKKEVKLSLCVQKQNLSDGELRHFDVSCTI